MACSPKTGPSEIDNQGAEKPLHQPVDKFSLRILTTSEFLVSKCHKSGTIPCFFLSKD